MNGSEVTQMMLVGQIMTTWRIDYICTLILYSREVKNNIENIFLVVVK